MSQPMFYVEHLGEYAWDYILWWKPNRQGYTYDIRKAGLYTLEEATAICKVRGQERAWAEEAVLTGVEHAVSIEKLHALGHQAAYVPTREQRKNSPKNKKPNFIHCPSKTCKAYKKLSEARAEMLACYRLQTRPPESLFVKVAQAEKVLEIAGEERRLQEGKA